MKFIQGDLTQSELSNLMCLKETLMILIMLMALEILEKDFQNLPLSKKDLK